MKSNQVKQKIQAGGVALGTFLLEFNTTGIARIAAGAGAEFVVFDMEHTGWSIETIRMLIATAQSTDLTCIVRVPATEYHFIARALDMGADGIMVPMVESAAQAEKIVQCAKYPPMGKRGAVFSVSHDNYQGGDIAEKVEAANQNTLLLAQIETVEGLQNVEEIAAVDGIDVLFVGPADLSCSLGIPGKFADPKIRAAEDAVVEACRQHNKAAGHLPCRTEDAISLVERGYRFLAYGADLWLYQSALRSGLQTIKEHAEGQAANS